jgi:hypothetical protein
LPGRLVIPKVMTLRTLADVRELMRLLPDDHRSRSTWHRVAADIEAAADGRDIEGAAIALRACADVGRRRMPPAVKARLTFPSRLLGY